MCHVNYDFIRHWEPRYDEIAHDEIDYQNLIQRVIEEVLGINTISSDTFRRIYNWKAPRAKHYVRWDSFHIYENAFRNVLQIPDEQNELKIMVLDNLPGIGIPLASTILHFMYPNIFPIVDFRTVEALQDLDCLNNERPFYYFRDRLDGYMIFCRVISDIVKQYPHWKLRQIDRALSAYHKIHLGSMRLRCSSTEEREGNPAKPSQPNVLTRKGKVMIKGSVTSQGGYADGKDICELYVDMASANRLPHEYGKKKPIDMIIGDSIYEAGVHETKKGVVWISSVLYKKGPRREKARLVDVLAGINVKKGDKIRIKSNEDGTFLLEP
jgi:hypothetical protein